VLMKAGVIGLCDYKIQCKRTRENRNGCVNVVELAAQDWKFLDKNFEEYLIIYLPGVIIMS
jgi:hypothetical protein